MNQAWFVLQPHPGKISVCCAMLYLKVTPLIFISQMIAIREKRSTVVSGNKQNRIVIQSNKNIQKEMEMRRE
jgi:hypothetical protein